MHRMKYEFRLDVVRVTKRNHVEYLLVALHQLEILIIILISFI